MAGNNDYVIPIGIDPQEFNAGISAIENRLESLATGTEQANRDMQASFNSSVAASDRLNQSLAGDTAATAALRNEARTLGQTLGAALNAPAGNNDLEKRLARFQELMTKLQASGNKPINIAIDTARLEALGAALEAGADDLQVLGDLAKIVREQLSTMVPDDAGFQELSQQVQVIEQFMAGLNDAAGDTEQVFHGVNATFEDVYGELQPLSARLGELEDRLYEMALAGEQNTDQFRELQAEAIRYRQTIQQVDAQVDAFSRSSAKIDLVVQAAGALVGAFTAAQGAIALFGEENEEAAKIIQKVTGAMAVLQGIQAVAASLNREGALGSLLASRAQAAQVVTTTALTTATAAEAGATVGATTATRGFTAALLANPITAVLVLVLALVTAIVAFASSSDDAKEATDKLNASLERQSFLLDADAKAINRRIALMSAQAKAAGKAESDITKIVGEGIAARRNMTQKSFDEFIKNTYNNGALRVKADAETNAKIEDEYIAYTERLADLDNELAIQRLDYSKKVSDESEAAIKKAKEDAKKALDEQKKLAEEEQKIIDQRIKYAKEIRDNETALIESQYDRERTALVNAAEEKIEALENEKALSEENQLLRAEAILAINTALYAALSEMDKKEATERAMLEIQSREILLNLQEESARNLMDQVRIDFDRQRLEIEQQYKEDAALRASLIEAVNKAEIVATKKAKNNTAKAALEKEAERAELELEIAAKFVGRIPYVEEQKQLAILEVKLKYARLFRQQLIDQGNSETSIVVLNAQKEINNLQLLVTNATKDLNEKTGKGVFNLQKILFGDQGEKGNEAISKSLDATYTGIQQMTDFVVDQYQRQIDKRQELIDSYDEGIGDLEAQLDKEKELREQGFANNVAVLEAEIAAKKIQRDKEFDEQEELRKKQNNIRRAQLVVDTAVQASNLITAATEIFAGLAGIPFVGVPLALASIGVMIGGFVAAKISAFNAIGSGQSFGEGGWMDGPSHAAGGIKYRPVNGRGAGPELEGNEFVVRKSEANKYPEVLEAINEGSLHDISDNALRALLAGMGISLESDQQKNAIETLRKRDELRTIVIQSDNAPSEDLMAIRSDVAFLAQSKKESRDRWEDDFYFYERFGNKTKRRKK